MMPLNKYFIVLIVMLAISSTSSAQTDLETRYFLDSGLSLGVEDNQFTRIDYRVKQHQFGFSNSFLPSAIRKQFIDISYIYRIDIDSLQILPTISYSSNLRTDDLQIQSAYFEIPILYKTSKFLLMAKAGYNSYKEFLISGTAGLYLGKNLNLMIGYGSAHNFTTVENALSSAIMYQSKNVILKSGLELPDTDGSAKLRLVTSFSYFFRS